MCISFCSGIKKKQVGAIKHIERSKQLKKSYKVLKNQNGQAVMEYIFLTGLIGIFCLIAVKKIGKSMNTRLEQINKKITKEVVIK